MMEKLREDVSISSISGNVNALKYLYHAIENTRGSKHIELKILMLVYGGRDWRHKCFYTKDFEEKLNLNRPVLLFHLNRLVKNGLIEKSGAYPIYFEPIKSDELREGVIKFFGELL